MAATIAADRGSPPPTLPPLPSFGEAQPPRMRGRKLSLQFTAINELDLPGSEKSFLVPAQLAEPAGQLYTNGFRLRRGWRRFSREVLLLRED